MTQQDFINRLLLYVSELSDRTSPEDQPEMMLVTGKELEDGVMLALEQCGMAVVPVEPTQQMLHEGCRAGLDTGVLMDDTRYSCERAVWAAMLANVNSLN